MVAIANLEFQAGDFGRRVPRDRSASDCFACWFVRGLFVAFLVFWLILIAFALWHYLPDRDTVQGFLSPTAAQARDGGWIALSEGL